MNLQDEKELIERDFHILLSRSHIFAQEANQVSFGNEFPRRIILVPSAE